MKLAIYDFDGTYISEQALPILYKLWKSKHINDKLYHKIWRGFVWRYILYKLRIFGWSKRRFNPYTMRITADLFQSVPREKLDKFIEDYYEVLQGYIFPPMKKHLKEDRKNGYHTVLLSGNLDIILKPFKKDGFDTIIGSKSLENNQLLSSNEIKILIEDEKKQKLLDVFPNADYKESKAYADNGYDLPVLKLVGHAYAVNPDKELEKYAVKHNFKIIKK